MNQLNLVPALSFGNMYLIGVVILYGARGKEISLPDELKAKQQILQIVDDGELYNSIKETGMFPCLMMDGSRPVFVCVHKNDLHEIVDLLPSHRHDENKDRNKTRFV